MTSTDFVISLVRFSPVASSPVLDSVLRDEMLPEIRARRGLNHVQVGRRLGQGGVEEHIVASVWESLVTLDAAFPAAPAFKGLRRVAGNVESETLPLEIAFDFNRDAPVQILRVFRGTVRDGELDLYIEDARRGATADAESNHGPAAFYLGALRPASFVSVSLWETWSAIEASTGGNIRNPIATHNADRIVAGNAAHYEVLPETGPARAGGAP